MALILADRVKETSTTAGNGTFTLAGAAAGFQSFAVVGDGNTTYYCIAGQGTNEWEVGIGTYTSSGTTLARTIVLSNSSATEPTALVFAAGTKDVFVTYPSEKSVNLDASGNATALGTPVAFTGTNITGTAAGLTAGAATVLATARNIAGVSFDGSAAISIPLENLSDVSIGTAVVNELLGYNGTAWVNVPPNSASAGIGVVFYNATPVITAAGANNDVALLTFASIPVTTAEQVITGTAVSNTVLFSAFITVALNRLLFDAGIYDFTIWAGVDSIAGGSVTTITRQIYTATPFVVGTVTTTGTGSSRTATASSGTPFATSVIDASATNTTASYLQTPQGLYQITARTSDTVVTITTPSGYTNESAVAGTAWKKLFGVTTPAITSISPNYSELSIYTTQPSTVVTAATKMGILGFVTSDHTRTISLTYNGEDRNTHVNTPLANLHNDLAGLQGGAATEYFHSTSAEYTGTGTGVFVRATSPTLVTPDLGTPSALVGTNITGTATAFTASNVTTNANLTGEATSVGNAATLTNSAVIGKVLTGYTSGAGTVAATDTILQAIQKLNGNTAAVPGTVTSVSVVSNNGFAGTVATATSTPAITLTTTVTGILKGNNVSGVVSAATAASDYVAPSAYASANGLTIATARLLGRTTASTGAAEEITVGTGLSLSAGTLSASGGGVTTIGFGTTGLTPSGATSGVVTVAGTLAVANGGTGVTTSTGTGAGVHANSPTLVTPVLGVAAATSLAVSGFVGSSVTGSLLLPVGTTGERPAVSNGLIRYNTSTLKYEVARTSGVWNPLLERPLYRYFRYVVVSTTVGHHPRVSKLYYINDAGTRQNFVVFVGDNCSDSGTIPSNGNSWVIDLGGGAQQVGRGFGGYNTYAGGVRGANISLQGSNNNSSYDTIMTVNFQTSPACGYYDYFNPNF